jgi:hypothetical protein
MLKGMNRYVAVTALAVLACVSAAFAAAPYTVDLANAATGKVVGSSWTSTMPEEGMNGAEGEWQYLSVDLAAFNPVDGSFKVVIERKDNNEKGSKIEREAIVSFIAVEKMLVTFNIVWDTSWGDGQGTYLNVGGLQNAKRDKMWPDVIFLGKEVRVGGKLELIVTWDKNGGDLYVDGKKTRFDYDKPGFYKDGGPKRSFAEYVTGVTLISVGLEPSDGYAWGPANDTIIHSVEFYDNAAGALDVIAPEAVANIIADAPWGGEISVSWTASPSSDVAEYAIYRAEAAAPVTTDAPYQTTSALEYTDTNIIPGIDYYYAVVAVDAAGNRSDASDVVNVVAIAGDGPTITGITTDSEGKPVRPEALITVTLTGLSGGTATADITDVATDIVLAEVGSTGSYVGTYTITDDDVAATTASYRVVGSLTDDYGASQLAGPEVMIIGLDVINDVTPPTVAGLEHDGWQVAGFSGSLVPGDVITATLEGEASGFASFNLVGVTDAVPMAEVSSGIYVGSYTVGWDDEGETVALQAALADLAGNETRVVAGRTVEIDSRVRLLVTAKDELLPADSESETRIIVRAENANGDDVSGHELGLTLSTTEEYTGVVGGGKVGDKFASKDDEDDLEVRWDGVTDLFGEITATYTAGFAAKTALIVVKDLTTGDVGTGWLNTYVSSTVAIELTPLAARAASAQAAMRMSVSPGWLTADGRSKARVKVWLSDFNGNPISGARVSFALGSDNGSIRVVRGVTGTDGLAEADYRAGTVAGFVTISAASDEYVVNRNIQLELRSDAPAKIGLITSRVSLPADGRSTADLKAVVTDINDNPSKQVPVAFSVLEGSGSVEPAAELTGDDGVIRATYEAGRRAGTTIVEARHTSAAPSEDELRRIYGTVFVPRLVEKQERERMKIAKWLVEPGDEVEKNQPLVVLKAGKLSWTLTSPETGIFIREVRFKRDRVELGDTVGYVEIDPDVWVDKFIE